MAEISLSRISGGAQLEPSRAGEPLYLVYQTTNTKNGKIYVGVHVANKMDDGYLGSGINLRRAVKKYGRSAFRREIIFVCGTPEEMLLKEREVVTPEFVARRDTYNIAVGGEDGFLLINSQGRNLYGRNGENAKLVQPLALDALKRLMMDPDWFAVFKRNVSVAVSESYEHRANPFLGRKHSDETKLRIGATNRSIQSGSGNSQFGTCWVTDGRSDKKINKAQMSAWLKRGWSVGRAPSKKFLSSENKRKLLGL